MHVCTEYMYYVYRSSEYSDQPGAAALIFNTGCAKISDRKIEITKNEGKKRLRWYIDHIRWLIMRWYPNFLRVWTIRFGLYHIGMFRSVPRVLLLILPIPALGNHFRAWWNKFTILFFWQTSGTFSPQSSMSTCTVPFTHHVISYQCVHMPAEHSVFERTEMSNREGHF